MIAVEVVAVDSKAALETVVWLGCVQYDGLRRVWETRASQTVSQRLSQTNLLSIFGQSKVANTQSVLAYSYDMVACFFLSYYDIWLSISVRLCGKCLPRTIEIMTNIRREWSIST